MDSFLFMDSFLLMGSFEAQNSEQLLVRDFLGFLKLNNFNSKRIELLAT